jgi:hypothetical protein
VEVQIVTFPETKVAERKLPGLRKTDRGPSERKSTSFAEISNEYTESVRTLRQFPSMLCANDLASYTCSAKTDF